MKKLLGTVLAAALFVTPGLSNAEMLSNLSFNGSLDLQAVSAHNVTDFATDGNNTNDRLGTATVRPMVTANWDLLDDVHATVTLHKRTLRGWGTGNENLNAVQTATLVEEAKFKIDKVFGYVDMTFGRQFYGEPGDLIVYFGPRDDYTMTVTGIDAARFDYSNDMVDFTGVVGKTTGETPAAAAFGAQDSTDLHGFDLWWKGLPLKVDTFLWRQVVHHEINATNEPIANSFAYTYGLKLRGEAAGGWVKADLAMNAGRDRLCAHGNAGTFGTTAGDVDAGCGSAAAANFTGKAFLLQAGYKADVPDIGGFAPWANFGWGTGESDSSNGSSDNFQAVATDYRPGIINRRFDGAAGFGEVGNGQGGTSTNGLLNRVVYGFGLDFTPAAAEKLTVGAEYWVYRAQRIDQARNTEAGAGDNVWANLDTAARGASGNRALGSEMGLTAEWKHSENVVLNAGWAHYMPGGFILEQQQTANPANLLFFETGVKFGS